MNKTLMEIDGYTRAGINLIPGEDKVKACILMAIVTLVFLGHWIGLY
jgi:hypothetical protein